MDEYLADPTRPLVKRIRSDVDKVHDWMDSLPAPMAGSAQSNAREFLKRAIDDLDLLIGSDDAQHPPQQPPRPRRRPTPKSDD